MERRRLADISPTNKPYQTVFRLPQSLCKRPTSPCQPLSVGINKQPENPTPPLFSGCPMLLFLDFDGVLHSAYAFRQEQMFSQIPIFERFFRQPENAHIQFVISSTWRSGRDLAALRRPFSPDIAQRIIGKTPEHVATSPIATREQEILCYLADNLIPNEPWLALDDARSYFNHHSQRVYFCTAGTGLTERDLPELSQLIHRVANHFQAA